MTEQTEGAVHASWCEERGCTCGAFEDWYRQQIAAAEVRGAQAVLAAVEAIHRPSRDRSGKPWAHPYCVGCWEAGGEDGAPSHPCVTLTAARAAAAAAGGGGARSGPGEPPDDELAYGSRTGR